MKTTAIGYGVLTAALCVVTMGCVMTGSYQSAKTLDSGTSSFGMTFGVNEIQFGGVKASLPNVIPELTFHTGVAENMEVGGRIGLMALGIEGDFKYRFLKTGGLHMALAPAVGYQGMVFMKGLNCGLPLIATLDLSKRFALTMAAFGRYAHWGASDTSSIDVALSKIFGDAVMAGAAIGPDIHGETFFIRPMVEYARVFPSGSAQWGAWNRVSIAVHFGWIMGREKQQLDRIEKKIDGIDKKLDK